MDTDESEVTVYREYPYDIQIVHEHTPAGDTYQFEAPNNEPVEFETPDLAELYALVYFDVGRFREEQTGDRGVPPTVAAAGNDAVYAYLATQQGMSVEWLTRFFDVERETVHTYFSRVRQRGREAIDEARDNQASA